MRISNFPHPRPSGSSTTLAKGRRMAAIGVASLALLTQGACAANMGDWWLYVANDYPQDIRPLLAQGANPNRKTDKGQPAIMQAMRDKAWKVYDLLAADSRTDVNAPNQQDETPLMFLAVLGETDRAKALIARGAKVNRLGWTPLHYAASTAKLATLNLLLQQGAMVNAPAPDGTTPLMMAARSHNIKVVDALLTAGADATTRNLSGLSAADWARAAGDDAVARHLDEESQRQAAARSAGKPDTGTTTAVQPAPSPAAVDSAQVQGEAPAQSQSSPQNEEGRLRGVQGVRIGQ